MQMGQLSQKKDRVYIGAQVDRRQRDELIRLARRRDRSLSSIIRRALAAELERISERQGTDELG
jgi:predicted transcriptional regulator